MSYYFIGKNPVVDLLMVRTHPDDGLQALLIKRSASCDAEAGKFALTGGFRDTDAQKDQLFDSGKYQEPALDAAIRECAEETSIDTSKLSQHIKLIGVYTGPGRDPRETSERFSESHAFFLSLDGLMSITKSDALVAQEGEIDDVKWVKWSDLMQMHLAFDHNKICFDAQHFIASPLRMDRNKPKF